MATGHCTDQSSCFKPHGPLRCLKPVGCSVTVAVYGLRFIVRCLNPSVMDHPRKLKLFFGVSSVPQSAFPYGGRRDNQTVMFYLS